MAVITSLRANPDQEPADITMSRKLAGSEDVRILLGDFFLKLAAEASPMSRRPHAELLERMLDGRQCPEQLRILADDLDRLRLYDLGRSANGSESK